MTQLAKGFADKGATTPVVHTAELLDWATGGPLPEKLARAGIADRRCVKRAWLLPSSAPHPSGRELPAGG